MTTPDNETRHARFPLSNFPPQARERANESLREFHVKRALRAVLEWLDEHSAELMEDWQLAQQRKPLNSIAPLE